MDCRAERPQIVVKADSLELNYLAVEQEATVGGKFDRADSELALVLVQNLAITNHSRSRERAILSAGAEAVNATNSISMDVNCGITGDYSFVVIRL